MARYEVSMHTHGQPHDWRWNPPTHKWTRLNQKSLGLDAAKALADAQATHAVVLYWMTSEKVHDNGKAPAAHSTKPVLPAPACVAEPSPKPSATVKPAVKRAVDEQLARAGVALPRIVRFFEPTISPGGGLSCPHCGAEGSVIHQFQVEDGRRLGAMSGCVQLFPTSPVAKLDLELRKKETDRAKQGWSMASWDKAARDAIDDFYAGAVDEATTLRRVRDAKAAASAYRTKRYGR